MKQYTSEQILTAENLHDLQDTFCSSGVPFQYQMTEGEIEWYKFIRGKYAIADWVENNSDENYLLTFSDSEELKYVLEDDGLENKAVMLSDDSALQKLFFWLT